jgi:hypothetical protein
MTWKFPLSHSKLDISATRRLLSYLFLSRRSVTLSVDIMEGQKKMPE